MKVGLLNKIQGRTKVLSVIGLASLVMVSAAIQSNSISSQKLSALRGGLQTCFTRLHNSYTARLLRADSEYLSNSFTQTTEECLGETIKAYENLDFDNNIILDDLNTLANDTNWFHQKIMAQESEGLFEGNPENVLLSALGSRFEKLEIRKIQISDSIHSLQNALNGRKEMMSLFFYFIAALVPIFLTLDYLKRKSDEEELEEIMQESHRLLANGEMISMSYLKPIIIKALNVMGLNKLAQLFEVAYIRSEGDLKNDTFSGVQVPVEHEKYARAQQIEEMWTRPESHAESMRMRSEEATITEEVEDIHPMYKHKGDVVELEDRIAAIVDIISSKLFTMGVNLDIKSEEVKVYADEEALDQIIYHLLTNSLDNYDFEDPKKYLSITVRKLGGTVFLDIFDSGRQFSTDFLKQAKGLSSGILDHTDLAIAQSLATDMGAKISFENVSNEDGQQVGRKVQVVLSAVVDRNAKKSQKKLARIERGTKREILSRMES